MFLHRNLGQATTAQNLGESEDNGGSSSGKSIQRPESDEGSFKNTAMIPPQESFTLSQTEAVHNQDLAESNEETPVILRSKMAGVRTNSEAQEPPSSGNHSDSIFGIDDDDPFLYAKNKVGGRELEKMLKEKGLLLSTKPDISPARWFRQPLRTNQSWVFFIEKTSIDGEVKTKNVVKMIELSFTNRLEAFREVKILATMDHPNIIKPDGFFFEKAELSFFCYIVMPYIKYDFISYLTQDENKRFDTPAYLYEIRCKITFEEARALFLQLVEVLYFLHNHEDGFIHMDIKFANILVTEEGNIMLSDFGLAKELNLLTTQVGCTPFYGAPELYDYFAAPQSSNRRQCITQLLDIYSLGSMLCYLFVGFTFGAEILNSLSFSAIRDRIGKIFPGNIEDIQTDLIVDLMMIIDACLSKQKEKRPTAAILLHLPFFSECQLPNPKLSAHEQAILDNLNFKKSITQIMEPCDSDKGIKTLQQLSEREHVPSKFWIALLCIITVKFPKINVLLPTSLESFSILEQWMDEYSKNVKDNSTIDENDKILLAASASAIEFFEDCSQNGDPHSQFAMGFWHSYSADNINKALNYFLDAERKQHKLAIHFKHLLLNTTTSERLVESLQYRKETVGQSPAEDAFLLYLELFELKKDDSPEEIERKLKLRKFLEHNKDKLCRPPQFSNIYDLVHNKYGSTCLAEFKDDASDSSPKKLHMVQKAEFCLTQTNLEELLDAMSGYSVLVSSSGLVGMERIWFAWDKSFMTFSCSSSQRFVEYDIIGWLYKDPSKEQISENFGMKIEPEKCKRDLEEMRRILIQALRRIYFLHSTGAEHSLIEYDSFRIDKDDNLFLTNIMFDDRLLPPNGTIWSAPEARQRAKVSEYSDVYSFGVLLYLLFVDFEVAYRLRRLKQVSIDAEIISKRIEKIFQKNSKYPTQIPNRFIGELCIVIRNCLAQPEDRPSVLKLLNDYEFFGGRPTKGLIPRGVWQSDQT